MGYVDPDHRKRGLYTRLYSALVRRARDKGVRTVEGEVANDNTAMMAAAKAQGRRAVATRWVEEVG